PLSRMKRGDSAVAFGSDISQRLPRRRNGVKDVGTDCASAHSQRIAHVIFLRYNLVRTGILTMANEQAKTMGERILVIEDEPKISDMVKRGLIYEGYNVEVAGDGEKGLS